MTTASGRKKRLFTLVGLLLVLVLGLLWHAGSLMQTTRNEVRKSLPGAAGAEAPVSVGTPQSVPPPPAEAVAGDPGSRIVRKTLPPAVATPPPPVPIASEVPRPPVAAPAAVAEAPSPVVAAAPEPAAPAAAAPSPAALPVTPAAAPPASPPATAPKAAALQPPLPFSLLLSSCRDKANAVASLPQFRRAGGAPYVVRTEVKGKGEWWRVMSGSYGSAQEAAQAKKALGMPSAVVVRTPFAALIGEYPSEAAAADAAARVSAVGYFPYMVPRASGAVGLLAGAYLNQSEAERLQRELKAQGVATDIIRR